MSKIIEEKKKQVISVQELLKKSIKSNEGHDSTQEPFFQGDKGGILEMDHKELPEFPDSLNRHIKIMYECIGNPDIEVYLGEWTIMSLNKSLGNYNHYCTDGQENIFDIAFKYMGMGHIMVLSCDLRNHLLFKRNDGGSNGWDRKANYDNLLKYKTGDHQYMYFCQWKNEILKE
tara:strand:- start:145 stop:666 length:522 start_codon:yes stop_codon:yes gene_type:complete